MKSKLFMKEITLFKSELFTLMMLLIATTIGYANISTTTPFLPDGGNPNIKTETVPLSSVLNNNTATNSAELDPNVTITLGANPEICKYSTVATISYQTTGNPVGYYIYFNAAAHTAGLADQNNNLANGNSGSISVTIPWGVVAGVYHATVKAVRWNPSAESTLQPITITIVEATPDWTPSITGGNPAICLDSTTGIMTLDPNYDASVVRWEKQLNSGAWTPIATTLRTYSESPSQSGTWKYRTVHGSANCGGIKYSNPFTVTVNGLLSIALGQNPEVCQTTTLASIPYSSTTGSPDEWVMEFDVTAIGAGFVNNKGPFSPGSIPVNIPSNMAPGVYHANVKVKTNSPSCSSVWYPVTITILEAALSWTPTISGGNPAICLNGSTGTMKLDPNYTSNVVRWEKRLNSGSWIPITTTSRTYMESPSQAGTWEYRTVHGNANCGIVFSNPYTVTVNGALSIALGQNPEICYTTTSTSIPYTSTTGSPNEWVIEYSTTAVGAGFTNDKGPFNGSSIPVHVPENLPPGVYHANVTVITNYPVCSSGQYPVTITVNPLPHAGIISADQTICSGSQPGNITLSGQTGTVQWQSSPNNSTWTSISGATNPVLSSATVGSLSATTYFRALVQSGNCGTATSATATVTVTPFLASSVSIAASATTICSGANVTFTATPTNGGSSPTYQWKVNGNDVGGNSATFSTTTLVNSDLVSVVLTSNDSACATASPSTSNSISITVSPDAEGGAVTGGSTSCSSTSSGLLTLSGHTGTVVRWESAISPFTTWTPIANTTTTYSSETITQTTQFRAVVQSGGCSEVTSSAVTVVNSTTVWNGSSWDNGIPTFGKAAIMEANYTSQVSINACSLLVRNNSTVVISSGNSVTLLGSLTVESGSSFTLSNNANLLQNGTTNVNSGAISVKRFTAPLKRQDYSLWSTPTTGTQTLQSFSPATLSNRFYTYNTLTNLYVSVPNPSATTFGVANGYLIRVPNTHPSTPTIWDQGAFIGTPNSGNYTISMTVGGIGNRFNLVGNPYPSPISARAVVQEATNAGNITGTLYFWRKTNDYTRPSYSTWTTLGFSTNGVYDQTGIHDPNDVIQTGQGFFVEATGNGTVLNFNNNMRVDNHADQFFRAAATTSTERHRIWLNATNVEGSFSQTLLGYASNATNDVDTTDGKFINDGAIALTSLINDIPYTIQGRSLPFDTNDIVPLQFKATTAGTFTIAIDHVDGLFLGSQDIYLRDALTGVDHDLKSGGYSFASEAGTFTNRFDVVYTTQLGTNNPVLDANAVVIYKNDNHSFVINTGAISMQSVKVFDIRGRLLTSQNNINTSQTIVTAGQSNEVLLVQVTSTDGAVVTKKVVR